MPAEEPTEGEVEFNGYKCVFDSFTINETTEQMDYADADYHGAPAGMKQISGVLTFACEPPSSYLMRLHNPPQN